MQENEKHRNAPNLSQKHTMLHESTLLLTDEQHRATNKKSMMLHDASKSTGHFYRPSSTLSIEWARERRSRHSTSALHISQLGNLLNLSLFETNVSGLRPYPAAGGIYSVHPYIAALNVEELESGVHYVDCNSRRFGQIGTSEKVSSFLVSGIHQENKDQISAIMLLIIDTRLSMMKYHDRAWRFGLLEAGCLMQTIYLAAEKLGIAACGLGGISDRSALKLCGLIPSESVMFACGIALGGRKGS